MSLGMSDQSTWGEVAAGTFTGDGSVLEHPTGKGNVSVDDRHALRGLS